ncbi:family 43 glycosylhydrolase [Planosporangium thailandense]|uniref:Family 43 glycosylhydrolase n=1 Tax=Planosporangium thailandense TaxID=765197 RepID=A0ABX0XRV7_9ACTN|nr:family 43 glycosylhydrolase [Planosporangium thailandense]NJC68523.1 family 43 glycosylhydrolase [Planosporangium thailandense]
MALALTLPAIALPALTASAASAASTQRAATYTNPVSSGFADTFADPTVIRGQDGYWYAYGTSDPLRSGEGTPHRVPVGRSSDLTTWTFAGDALGAANSRPPFAAADASYWAPDVRYLDGRYVMYYTVTDTTTAPGGSAIGVSTAPTPSGPWTAEPQPVIAPRPGGGGGYLWTFDPAEFTDSDGTRYLYYGSYYGGVYVTRLSADGLHAVGAATMVAIDNKYEGTYVVHRDGYYYLFASSANCCAGPTTGYSVSVGRATSPTGPFVDANGVALTASRVGGTPVVTQNGNRWVGTGHNGLVTDLSGQDYLVYHAIDRNSPYLDQPYGINRRPMLLDRLDWIDGWPTVRAGAGASDTPQPAPVTAGDETFATRPGWLPSSWQVTDGYATGTGVAYRDQRVEGDVRVEADLRPTAGAAAGVVVGSATAWLDRAAGLLVVDAGAGRRAAVALPAGLDYGTWHNVAVEVRHGQLTAALTEARQSGPIVSVTLTLPPNVTEGRLGIAGRGRADVDNVSAAKLYRPVTRTVAAPRTGHLVYADEFTGSAPGPGWSWVRRDNAVTVAGGQLNWPVENADLTGTANSAGVLLRDAPAGDYTVETKVTLDLGENTVRNYQQAGLVAYANDDDFVRLCQVAIWNTRQIEYGHEMPYAGQLSYGGVTLGTPATTTWLRLVHTTDPKTGEHRFRAASSADGRHWTWSGVWTFPADVTPRIGLVAHGGAQPAVTAQFDYVRIYQP